MAGGKTRKWGYVCGVVLGAVLVGVHVGEATAEYIDQSNADSYSYHQFVDLAQDGPYGQEFVPSVAEHIAVELQLTAPIGTLDPPSPGGLEQPANVTLSIRAGSIDGVLVAGAQVTRLLSDSDLDGSWIRFTFDQPVILTPGELYVLDVSADGPVSWRLDLGRQNLIVLIDDMVAEVFGANDRYLPGQAIYDGQPASSVFGGTTPFGATAAPDFGFRTVVATDPGAASVPEPAGIFLVPAGILAMMRSRRVRLPV